MVAHWKPDGPAEPRHGCQSILDAATAEVDGAGALVEDTELDDGAAGPARWVVVEEQAARSTTDAANATARPERLTTISGRAYPPQGCCTVRG